MTAQTVASTIRNADLSERDPAQPNRNRPSAMANMTDAARQLARQNLPVFPCDPATKRPLVAGGFKAASTDLATIATWWSQWPRAMIGVPTGEPSGLVVLDIDRDVGRGIDGFASLAAMEAAHESLPQTRTQRTPRGGEHRLFSWPGFKIKNSASKLGTGLDIRGDGGYIIIAPSENADGISYEWTCQAEPVAAPNWLLLLLDGRKSGAGGDARTTRARSPDRRTPYAAAALVDECGNVARAGTGQRNQALNRAAYSLGQLIGADAIDRGQVESALVGAAAVSGLVVDDGEEAVRRTIGSGLDAGIAEPRDIPGPWPRPPQQSDAICEDGSGFRKFDRTEDGIALAFTETHKGDLRFCHHIGKWYIWTGSRWQKEETKLAFNWARDICRNLNSKSEETLAKASTAAAVERFAQADRTFAITSAVWDVDPYLLGTPAGVVDLRTGLMLPAARQDYITKQTAASPEPGAVCPLWRRFLDEATLGDTGLQRFLQQIAGYCLTGDVREHALFFVYGPGGNGKSVFVNVLAGVMGNYATTAAMDTFTASATDRHPTDLAMLQGARMVSASETEEGRAWAESRIKQMTGGDPIRARFMRQDFFEYRPHFKLLIIGNHKPVLRNVDEAARRRFNIIPFVHKPQTPDRQLEEKLKGEWPAILAWAIEGALDWQKNGLLRPAVVANATDEYFTEQDSVRQWVEECCDTGGRTLSDTTAALFASWSAYAQANGERSGTTKWFSQILQRHGYDPIAETPGQRKKRGFLGISVKPVDTAGQWQNRMEADHDERR